MVVICRGISDFSFGFSLLSVKSHIILIKLVNYMIFLLVKDAVLFKLSYNLIKFSELYDSSPSKLVKINSRD